MAVARVKVERGGGPAGDPDIDMPGCGLGDQRAAVDCPDADPAVGCPGTKRAVRVLDVDVAVGCLDPEIAADLANLGVTVGVPDDRGAVDLAGANLAGAGRELGVAGDSLHCDVANAALELAAPERTGAVKFAGDRTAAQLRPGGEFDLDVDRAADVERVPFPQPARSLDQQPAVGVRDACLFGRGHVVTLGRLSRPHPDDRVCALPGRDAHVRQAQVQLDRDWLWCFEVRHVLGPMSRWLDQAERLVA